ncbi:MAG: YlbF family regulator [Anaerolineales bacterium]
MNQPTPETTPVQTADPFQAARALGELLRQTPEYAAFLEALTAVNADPQVRKLSEQLRACQSALQWGRDVVQNAAEMERLEAELESLSIVQAYRQAEAAVRETFLAVDELISREAGVDFAANARRSCCG